MVVPDHAADLSGLELDRALAGGLDGVGCLASTHGLGDRRSRGRLPPGRHDHAADPQAEAPSLLEDWAVGAQESEDAAHEFGTAVQIVSPPPDLRFLI